MKAAALFLAVLAPAWCQIKTSGPVQPLDMRPPGSINLPLKVVPQTFTQLEKRFDDQLGRTGGLDHVYLLGSTRALYLDGYGVVATAEVDLIQSPNTSPFHMEMTPQEIASVHERKIRNVSALKVTMQTMMMDLSRLPLPGSTDQQIVLAVRILYLRWENTAGLPAQILMHATRAEAFQGKVQTEEQ